FRSVEKRRRRAMPVITSTFEKVSDIGVCPGLCLGPPAKAGVRSKRGALQTFSLRYGNPGIEFAPADQRGGNNRDRRKAQITTINTTPRNNPGGRLCRNDVQLLARPEIDE